MNEGRKWNRVWREGNPELNITINYGQTHSQREKHSKQSSLTFFYQELSTVLHGLQQQQMMFAHLLWNLPLLYSPELIVELSINYSKVKNELSSLLTFKLTWTRSPKRSQNNGEFRDLQFHDKEESRGNTVCWWRPCYTVESSKTSELVGLECFVNSCFPSSRMNCQAQKQDCTLCDCILLCACVSYWPVVNDFMAVMQYSFFIYSCINSLPCPLGGQSLRSVTISRSLIDTSVGHLKFR